MDLGQEDKRQIGSRIMGILGIQYRGRKTIFAHGFSQMSSTFTDRGNDFGNDLILATFFHEKL
ncbi:hypothetical protein KAS08_04335 [Candidatus Pacearchaeota archaeon]|nr:hypothetical protein [Candidatus Pacearchaeota archaeon]